jgi:hypothetical protein
LHGTTVLPSEGVTCGLSQNLAKKTVTAIKKWRDGSEQEKHIKYRSNQLNQDPYAKEALLESIKKNSEKKSERIEMEENNYTGEYIDIERNDREWAN